jgi:hypothetical protein
VTNDEDAARKVSWLPNMIPVDLKGVSVLNKPKPIIIMG